MLKKFSSDEQQILFDCLRAAAYGPFIGDRIFPTLMGLDREFVRNLADQWPLIDFEDEQVQAAIGASMLNLTSYPHKKYEQWDDYFSSDKEVVYELMDKFRQVRVQFRTDHQSD